MQEFIQLKKNLRKDFSNFKNTRLAILSDSASQFLHTSIRGYGFEEKANIDIYEAEYNQIDLEVFNVHSGLYEFKPEFIFINYSTEHVSAAFSKLTYEQHEHFSEDLLNKIAGYLEVISAKLSVTFIFNTLPEINDSIFGNYASKLSFSFIYQIRKFNLALMELSQKEQNVFILDLNLLQSQFGRKFSFDSKMYVNGDMVYSLDLLPFLAKNLVDIMLSIQGQVKKCLILDLDNTLWGGIIGDDGLEGIQIGYLGIGKVFTEFQYWVKQLKNRGIILAVCSKNTDFIAREPFISHPDMVLRLEDIAIFVANWNTKVSNISYIQSVLNIGFDSMVFIDDNPFEREIVRSAFPQIVIPDLPEEPEEYLAFLRTLNLFETASFTREDEARTQLYQQEAQRNQLMTSFGNEDDFLSSLNMVAATAAFSAFNIPRVAQLTQRSNQFNLRTIRYTESDLKLIADKPEWITMACTLKDKFGDHGLIGIVIMQKIDARTLFIDTWAMSCRVLKRGMEALTLNAMVAIARNLQITKIIGEYLPTRKNELVKDHYSSLGFSEFENKWVLDISAYKNIPTNIQLL